MNKHYIGIGLIIIFIIIINAISFNLTGSPLDQKGIRFDQTRINNFKSLTYKVEDYVIINKKLPENLSDLNIEANSYVKVTDPETEKPFEYKKLSNYSYALCTTFSKDSSELDKRKMSSSYSLANNEKHKKGYDCVNYTLTKYALEKIEEQNATPSAELSSIRKIDECKWSVNIKIKGLDIKRPIFIESKGNNAKCDTDVFMPYSWAGESNVNSSIISYSQEDYGTYTYSFTDKNNKKASVTFTYNKDTITKP